MPKLNFEFEMPEVSENELQDEMTRQFDDYYFIATDRDSSWASSGERHSFECGFARGIEYALQIVRKAYAAESPASQSIGDADGAAVKTSE